MTARTATPDRRRGRRLWWLLGLPLLLLLAGYVALAWWATTRMPSGTSVGGVSVGGLSEGEARSRVAQEASRVAKDPVAVEVGDQRFEIVPSQAGTSIDAQRSVAGVTGFSLNPATVFDRLSGGQHHPAAVRVDQGRLASEVDRKASDVLDDSPEQGTVEMIGGEVQVHDGKPGQGVDSAALAQRIQAGWPQQRRFSAPVSQREASVSNAELHAYADGWAKKAMSGPITIKTPSGSVSLPAKVMSDLLSTDYSSGAPKPHLDTTGALEAAVAKQPTLERPSADARYVGTGASAKVQPAVNGVKIDRAAAGPTILAALTSPTRTANLRTAVDEPRVTTAQAQQWKAQLASAPQVSTFSTHLPGGATNAARTKNIRLAASRIDGMVVAPGQQFSLTRALGGNVTAKQGYLDAPTIQGGREKPAVGGGLSQISTTLYNAAFFAGVRLDEHQAHSFWIERYPMGREATLWVGHIDNKWTNDTGHPIVIRTATTPDHVTFSFHGTKVFQVSTTTGPKTNVTPPKTVHASGPQCLPNPTQDGFTVTVTRTVKQGSKVVKNERITTVYKAADRVVCG